MNLIAGWGNYPTIQSQLSKPRSYLEISRLIEAGHFSGICRGMGRSYGDSSLANKTISTLALNHYIHFDNSTGLLSCEAGTTLDDIFRTFTPQGWFLPVTPGTKFVSVGGAIASDVHGKNHHVDGSFSDHIVSLKVMLATGEVIRCTAHSNQDLFRATCGGMGLTGIILEAEIQLKPISSSYINQTTIKAKNLNETLDLFEQHSNSTYSVAWIDCLTGQKRGNNNLGRSLLFLGEHVKNDQFENHSKKPYTVPFVAPDFILNKYSTSLFTSIYYNRIRQKKSNKQVHYDPYFFPLDNIHYWNRIYGKRGFTQYQFVLPKEAGKEGMKIILEKITESSRGSFLSVLKAFGKGNDNFLSFPTEGYTLALDFKMFDGLFALLDNLDKIVLDYGGRIYLTKDVRMSEHTFKSSYKNWQRFCEIRTQYGADKVFHSLQSKRLGI